MIKAKNIVAIGLSIIMTLSLAACGKTRNNISLGTGNMGGNYYSYGNALSQVIQDDSEKMTVTVKTTAGSAANLRLIQDGFLDMAIVQSDTLLDAYSGTGVFAGKPSDGVRAIAGLYTEECQIVVPSDSDIETISDLYGKRVSVGEKESGVMKNAEEILFVNGLKFDMLDASYLSFSDSAAAMENGEIDAFFCTSGAPTTAIAELAKTIDIRLISFDSKTISQLTKHYPGYTACVIPAGTYANQEEDINTVGVKAVLIASNKLSDDQVYTITSSLFGHATELQYATVSEQLDKTFATEDIPVPFHNGASKWYSEQGITVSSDANGSVNFGVSGGQD